MPEQNTYPYENGKFYWVEKNEYFGEHLKEVAKFDSSNEVLQPVFYLPGDEQGHRLEFFDKIHPEPIPEPE